jgi:hypothetical protein
MTNRLQEIRQEIETLADEALAIVKKSGKRIEVERARSYWHAHIICALTNESQYLGGSMCTLEDAISALEEDEDETDPDED